MDEDCNIDCDNFFNYVHIKEGLDLKSIGETGALFEPTDLDLESSKNDMDDLESNYTEITEELTTNLFSEETEKVITNSLIDNSFDELAKEFLPITTEDNSILKQVVCPGIGEVVPSKSIVKVHYNAYLEYSEEPFDSTRLRKKPFNFELGNADTIEGFDLAVATMRKKEISKFLICPEYAYGSFGCPPRIPPDAICLYVIEVLDFTAPGEVSDEYFLIPMSERKYAPLEVVLKACNHIRNASKKHFHENKYYLASKSYYKVLSILENHHLKDEEEEKKLNSELVKLHTNIALCHLKLKQSVRAIHHCNEIFKLQGDSNIKALYFKGKALRQIGEFQEALKYLERANRMKPKKKEVLLEIEKAKKNLELFSMCILNKENNKFDEQITKCQNMEQFEASIEMSIRPFIDDDEIVELPLPSFHFTQDQVRVVKNLVQKFDLLVKEIKNVDGEMIMYIYKKFHPSTKSKNENEEIS